MAFVTSIKSGAQEAAKKAIARAATAPSQPLPAVPAPAPAAQPIKAPGATKITPTAPIKLDTSGIEKEFGSARERASQREGAAVQAQRDALARRAAMGGGGISGAIQKQENIALNESAQRLGDMNAQIDAAKTGELRRVSEAETQLNLQAQEADRQRQFAADEAAAGREFQSTLANADLDMKQKAIEIQQSQFAQQLDLSLKQFDWEKFIDQKNLDLANRIQTANEQPGALDNLFAGLGIGKDGKNLATPQGLARAGVVDAPLNAVTGGGYGYVKGRFS